VVSDGPADRAGIRAGDVILAINGRRIPHVNALGYLLTTVGIGNDAKIRVISRGNRSTKTLVLEAAPETIPANETLLPANSILGGATVANLSPALAQKIRVPGNKTGVIVLELKRRSPAAGMRIRPGDIIREINGTAIERVANLSRPLQQRTNRWQIVVERQGRELVLERRGRVFRQYLR
jgi:S1-C subfamily serine protease